MEVFELYGIKEKVMSITFDNSTNNNVAISLFKKYLKQSYGDELFHKKCAYHINLVVQDDIKQVMYRLENIHEALQYIASFGSRLEEF